MVWFNRLLLVFTLVCVLGCRVAVEAKPKLDEKKAEATKFQDKAHFIKVVDESVRKLTLSKDPDERKLSFLRKFSQSLRVANSEEELYWLVNTDASKKVTDDVLFTGYYKPVFKGSYKKSAKYPSPLYSLPKPPTTLTRKELCTSGKLRSREMIYLQDPFEAYLAEIQGSVGIQLENGEVVHLAFAGSNGEKYVSIGTELVKDKKLTKVEATIPGIRNYFEKHPSEMQEYIYRNPRLVFFRKSAGMTLGSAGVELLQQRTIATDRLIYPPGSVVYVKVDIPKKLSNGEWGTEAISKFMISLDSGSAINGPKRVDLYLGEGAEVGEVAGRLNQRGTLEVYD